MGLKKLADKVDKYKTRLEGGKASKIKPDHVEKTLQKLRKNLAELEAEEKKASSPEKKARLKRKRGIALTHVERANWLLKQLE
jgi:hypothetical protein